MHQLQLPRGLACGLVAVRSLQALTNVLAVEFQYIFLELGLDLAILVRPQAVQVPIDLNPVISGILGSRKLAICAIFTGAIVQSCKASTDVVLN